MDLRPITSRTALQAGVECWNRAFPATPIAPRIARQRLLMPAPGVDVDCWGGYRGGDLRGVVATKRLPEPIAGYDRPVGWVSMLAVDPQVGETRAAVKCLLDHAVDWLSDRGAERVGFGGDLRKVVPGLPSEAPTAYVEAVEAVGFERDGPSSDLYYALDSGVADAAIEQYADTAPGVTVRPARPDNESALREFVERNFPGRWAYQVESNCRLPGAISDYWLVCEAGTPVAFAGTGRWDSTVLSSCVNWGARWGPAYCGLGPIGVAESHRGNGYGLALIATVMQQFRADGHRHMTIDGVRDGLFDYYAKLGFEPALSFEQCSTRV
jgi:predicted N-acetyltransferase YhbS